MSERQTVVVVSDDDVVRGSWGVLLAIGIVAIVFGVVVLFNIWGGVRLVAILAGLFLVFVGVMQFVSVRGHRRKAGRIISGVIALAIGIVLIVWPDTSVKTVAILVGLAFLIWGIAWAVAALVDRGEGWGVAFGFSIVLVIVGAVFIAWPGPTIAIMMALVGIAAIVFGIGSVAQGLALRKA
jgi:uncharacterized membrane protein HdeD (DUF308 family)